MNKSSIATIFQGFIIIFTKAVTRGNFLGIVRKILKFLKSQSSKVPNFSESTKYCLKIYMNFKERNKKLLEYFRGETLRVSIGGSSTASVLKGMTPPVETSAKITSLRTNPEDPGLLKAKLRKLLSPVHSMPLKI
jgi:hypothetical protein